LYDTYGKKKKEEQHILEKIKSTSKKKKKALMPAVFTYRNDDEIQRKTPCCWHQHSNKKRE
jgi:hypothetical protein